MQHTYTHTHTNTQCFGIEFDALGYSPTQLSQCTVAARTPVVVYKISIHDVLRCWLKPTLFRYRSMVVRRAFLHG
jgi:hypothetical protein